MKALCSIFCLFLVACQNLSASPESTVLSTQKSVFPTAEVIQEETLSPPASTSPVPTLLTQLDPIRLAVEDLAQRLGISDAAIDVISVEQAEMPLQNLGCGEKIREDAVIPAFVTAWVIYLQVGEKQYEYRVHKRRIILCE